MQQILLKLPENNSMVQFFIFMNNVIRKIINSYVISKNMIFFSFAGRFLGLTINNLSYWWICLSGPIPHLLKTKLCILTWTWWSQFFDFHEKRKQVHGKFSVHDIFCITIYRCTKCTCKSKFQNDVRHFPQCMSHNEMIVLLSVLSV